MKKYELIQALIEAGAVAVIRAENKTQGLKIVEAVRAGGITAIEITMTVPHTDEIIRELSEAFGADVLLGAGTVLDAETARTCIIAGAQYIVGPSFNEGCARLCNRYAVPYIPGVMTPQEAVRALEFGADILKLFPAELFGKSSALLRGRFRKGFICRPAVSLPKTQPNGSRRELQCSVSEEH